MFDTLIRASLAQRALVLAASLVLVVGGLWSLRQTPVDVFPDLNRPTVTLMTESGGMAPEEVENLVTFPVETAMSGMPGVVRVRSVSSVGLSLVFVEFDWGTDVLRNRQLVAERLAAVGGALPRDIVPRMGPITSIMGEIALVALPISTTASTTAADGGHAMATREFADWVLRPRLLNIPGISQVIPIGGEVRQYRVVPDVRRMEDVGVTLEDLARALSGFASNTAGGFLEQSAREILIRHIGRTTRVEDLENLVVGVRNRQPVLLRQVASVGFAPGVKRGDAGVAGGPAVIVSVQKQPQASTVKLTREVEAALAEVSRSLPPGVGKPEVLFRQADFIEHAVDNVEQALRDGAIMVAIVLFLFLGNARTTIISLTAIPVSLCVAFLVFRWFGLSVNTMTLGGLAIAIGELVDDAVVDVENVLRRLRENAAAGSPLPVREVVARASNEVRSGIVYATLIIVLVFVPLFTLPGIEGRLFVPLGVAYVVSILASMAVAVSLTPVLCSLLLPAYAARAHHDSRLVAALKALDRRLLAWSFGRPRLVLGATLVAVLAAVAVATTLPRSFLPPFNEGTLTVNVLLNPGTSLAESNRVGALAERLVAGVPEVAKVGRRTGRAELDEHAEGVHYSELEVDLRREGRPRADVIRDIRTRLAALPASVSVGQPISHRLDHLLSGVRAQIALKVVGDDLDTLRGLAATMESRMAAIRGIADLQVEKQVLIPQQQVRIDYARAAALGVSPPQVLRALETLIDGARVAQVIDGARRFDVLVRVADGERAPAGLARLLIETPGGRVPLSAIATIEDAAGPNQIGRDNGRRRIVVSANVAGRDLSDVVAELRTAIAQVPLPQGYHVALEGQFQAQEEATRLIGLLSLVSLGLILAILYSRYRSATLALVIVANIPLALVGAVAALWLAGQPLSVATLVGFVTLAGISTRNGILKISHYINLCRLEGETFGDAMIVRGSLERLTPVLMTALVAAFALVPLVLSSDAPGKEILHPVAVVIFGGLVSSTLLDTIVTPVMFRLWGRKPLERLLASGETQPGRTAEIF